MASAPPYQMPPARLRRTFLPFRTLAATFLLTNELLGDAAFDIRQYILDDVAGSFRMPPGFFGATYSSLLASQHQFEATR